MFIFGILAIIQMLFLPGLIFHSLFKPKGGFFYQLSVVVAMSMLVNATLIYPLTFLYLYTKTLILICMLLEFLALAWLYRSIFKVDLDSVGQAINAWARKVWTSILDLFAGNRTSTAVRFLRNCLIAVIGGLAVSLLFWFLRRLTNNFGSVFNTWDAVVSWNSWAQIWAQGKIPDVQLTYPQLLPLNLSLTYLLTGNYELSFFAKAVMPIFALLTVLTIAELALEQKQYGYLIAVSVTYLLYKNFLGDYITEGYADIPVAFMCFTALVPYLRDEDFLQDKKGVILSLLLAAAAALTKQVGIYILVILPILALLTSKSRTRRQILSLLFWFGIGVVLLLPWYLPLGIQVLHDSSISGFSTYIALSAQTQNSASPFLRIGNAFVNLGKYLALYLFLIPALFLVKQRYRLLVIYFLIPYSLLWGFLASYDTRNLTITFASLAVITGLGLETIMEFCFKLLERIRIGRLGAVFLSLLVILPVGYFALKLSDAKLLKSWQSEQSQIFSPEIDAQLYGLDRSNPDCKKILTNYPVYFLPELESMQLNSNFNDYASYEKFIADPGVCWMLKPNNIDPAIQSEIDQNLQKGTYKLLFTTTKWIPYQLIKIR